jgi:hypothetical protein
MRRNFVFESVSFFARCAIGLGLEPLQLFLNSVHGGMSALKGNAVPSF